MADDDTPLDIAARHMRFTAEPLQSLLRAYKTAVMQDQWEAVEHIERAIYKSREGELAKLVEIAKAPPPSED